MTKTEAAEILANDVRVFARHLGLTSVSQITKDLVEARLSEARHTGGQLTLAATVAPSWKTILRTATKWEL